MGASLAKVGLRRRVPKSDLELRKEPLMSLRSKLVHWFGAGPSHHDQAALQAINPSFESLTAHQRVERALELLPGVHVMSSSFGAQSAVMLHLVNSVAPGTPVVLTDTGYLFPETYRFIDELTEKLALNLKIFRSDSSPAWQESRFGKLWNQGLDGIERYNQINKKRAYGAGFEGAGRRDLVLLPALRPGENLCRRLAPIEFKRGRFKVHPIF